MNRLAASLAWLFCVTTVTTVYVVVSPGHLEGDIGKILTVATGVVVGTAISMAGVWLYGLTAHAERSHWTTYHHEVTLGGLIEHVLVTRHWHRTIRLRCELRDPQGERFGPLDLTWITQRGQERFYEPGEKVAIVSLVQFGAPIDPTLTGTYKLRWLTSVEGREKPVTLATEKWHQGTRRERCRRWAARQITKVKALRHPLSWVHKQPACS